jgi:hypothetical protein
MTYVKLQTIVPSSPDVLKRQNAEALGMQVILHLAIMSIYSEKYLYCSETRFI